jgi:hypothetical protein
VSGIFPDEATVNRLVGAMLADMQSERHEGEPNEGDCCQLSDTSMTELTPRARLRPLP